MEDLLTSVPEEVRLHRPLNLPAALPEPDLKRLMSNMAAKNKQLDTTISFLGAGTYDRTIPSVVPHLQHRSEFVTSYTSYQPEVSQGMLQAIYEFQTMVCQITDMDIANASLYDGSTALVEAVLMALGPGGRGEVVISLALILNIDVYSTPMPSRVGLRSRKYLYVMVSPPLQIWMRQSVQALRQCHSATEFLRLY